MAAMAPSQSPVNHLWFDLPLHLRSPLQTPIAPNSCYQSFQNLSALLLVPSSPEQPWLSQLPPHVRFPHSLASAGSLAANRQSQCPESLYSPGPRHMQAYPYSTEGSQHRQFVFIVLQLLAKLEMLFCRVIHLLWRPTSFHFWIMLQLCLLFCLC
jgi:hypothetical protein